MRRLIAIVFAICLAPVCFGQGAERMKSETGPKTIIGPRNPNLQDGANALIVGDAKKGVELTLAGLKSAIGVREEEAALSNLCAGYILLEKFNEALRYCNQLLDRNSDNWRAYNNRAVIYIKTGQFAKAEQDLLRGEELRPGAHTLKVARAMYMDAVFPVAAEITVDDSDRPQGDEPQ